MRRALLALCLGALAGIPGAPGRGSPARATALAPCGAGCSASVTLDAAGTTALVGEHDGVDGVDMFGRSGGAWASQGGFNAPRSGTFFGYATALDAAGGAALVGAPFETVGERYAAGAAYVFTRSGGGWRQPARLTAGGTAQEEARFGSAVALDGAGSIALVGAPSETARDHGYAGAAYVFTRGGGGWRRQARLTAGSSAGVDGTPRGLARAWGTPICCRRDGPARRACSQ